MGQTNIFRLCQNNKKLMLCMMLLMLTCISSVLLADIAPANVAVETNFGGSGTENRLNGAGSISLRVTWQGDSPPFTAKYKKGGDTILSDGALNANNTSAKISAISWGDTNGTEEYVTVEIVDSAGRSSTGDSQRFIIDTLPPQLTANITNGPFAQNSTVRIQITSNERINPPTVTCNGATASAEGTPEPGNSFVYNLPLNESFVKGVEYKIKIEATDVTIPSTAANHGTTEVAFTIGTSSTGSTNIDSCTPSATTNSPSIVLNGTSPSGVAKVRILDGSEEVTTVNTTQTSWQITLQPSEDKEYKYVAVSIDTLDQEISRSPEFTVKIDRTAPSVPEVQNKESIPQQTNSPSYQFSVKVDGYESDATTPVYIQAYNNTQVSGEKIPINATPQSISVELSEGSNVITFRAIDTAGNESAPSDAITINKSGEASGGVSNILVDNYPTPLSEKRMLGSGNHEMKIYFSQDCNTTSSPVVEIICAGGSKITVNAAWEDSKTASGTFSIPSNGGPTVDGQAQINIREVKDAFGNTLDTYSADGFRIDSTPPTSVFTNPDTVYVSATNSTVTLQGNITDNDGGSGIEYLELFENRNGEMASLGRVPLQKESPSPWTYAYDAKDLEPGEHKLVTSAVDMAVPNGNAESTTGKTGITLFVDNSLPEVTRISLNNTGIDISTYGDNPVIASDVTRIVAVASDTGSGLDLTNTNFIFKITGPNGDITGEKSNNNNDTIYFDFPVLTASGEYRITVTPVDKAGNTGETASRTFTLNKSAPDAAEFFPPSQSVANKTEENLASNSVKVTLSNSPANPTGTAPSYAGSTISVKYNGVEVGDKNNAITDALVATLHGGNLKTDGSHDGNYYITVTPRSLTGIAGQPITSSFIYDTQPPVIVNASPSFLTDDGVASDPIWFGLKANELSITVSDAPKDILERYKGQYPDTATAPVMPVDTTWYNSSGSGINFDISTFTWQMGSQESTNHSVSGNKMTVKIPSVPENTAAGVADVEATIVLADRVTQGESVPNYNIITRIYKFDYAPPKIEIKSENGKKYCKNLLTINAEVKEEGSDNDLKVTKVLYRESKDDPWKEAEVDGLPGKTASVSVKIDITSKTDGNESVYIKAIDRAGNESDESTFAYTVDRTPPNPPELTIPLADYTVNKRNQAFKWAPATDATAYLFQISDDSSFNNILNHQTNNDYPGLKGCICTTTDGSFSLPKDGTFYWRVASLEKCQDGFNIGEFSETRKVIIDTVKPYILSISPSPSSSNTVSTGMVTFTIRFNEPLDSTIDLSATLTSAGGQVMKIEKVNSTGDTWVGTTVIPKNNSAVYDGNAIIAVDGAADLAGNLMAADSSHTIVVNTGPAFTTKLFSNPANEYEITIITKSSESLQTAPSVTVRQNAVKTPITMNFLKDKFYTGSYKIDKENPGSAYINISGTDLYGKVGTSIVEFIIADLNASSRLNITSASGRATLKAAESSTFTPTAVYIIDRESLEPPFSITKDSTVNASLRASAGVRTQTTQNSELIGVLGLDEIGPSSVKLKKCMLYTADVNGEVIDNSSTDKIHIYRQDSNGKWVFQGGELKDYKISAQITGLGRLALMADKTAPRMSSLTPENQAKLKTNLPEIKGQFVDNGSGLVTDSFKLYIDGMQIKDVELNKDGTFAYQVKQTLREGKHEIKCEVSDKAGNSFVRAVTVDAPDLIQALLEGTT